MGREFAGGESVRIFSFACGGGGSVIPRSLRLLPSACLGGIPDGKRRCNGIYEHTHGESLTLSGIFGLFPDMVKVVDAI